MKKILLVFISLWGMKSFAQEQSNNGAVKNLTGAQLGILHIGVYDELRLSDNFVLRGEVMLNAALWDRKFSSGTNFALFPMIEITPKYYYNFKRRLKKSKNIQNNSANYFALNFSYSPDWLITSNRNDLLANNAIAIIPTYGIRRNFAKNFNYEFATGLGYARNIDTKESWAALHLSIALGYDF